MFSKEKRNHSNIMAPMRRKSHGSIRSPPVKRNSQSQVTLEGWLYKLEGAPLKQFKHRWCVLADFCLFFYKGPREEKVTSSILLPSYKISPCTSDDRISRKFSFKAEHQNMKTYYFAAEEKENMKQWMNAMSLASIMQQFGRLDDDDESGFTSYQSKRYTSQKLHTTPWNPEPLHQRSKSFGEHMGEVYLSSDDKYPTQSYRQPLYVNAPPKPRRLNDYPQHHEVYYPPAEEQRRPQSANFLEQEVHCPGRPKSSLEYYVDSEDCDSYREAVRQQADHLYARQNESLQRLQEWKQRMLRSPLLQQSHRNINNTNDREMHSFSTMPNVSNIGEVPESKSLKPQSQSTTYSSDDEASVDSDGRHQALCNQFKSMELTRSIPTDLHTKESTHLKKLVQQSEGLMSKGKRLSVSAGDLLGKTHEELVLLLIQLRRNQAKILRAKGKLQRQMKNVQDLPPQWSIPIRLLDQQHEVTRPLVSLVDNMVKLGTLYGNRNDVMQEEMTSSAQEDSTNNLSRLLTEESNFQNSISELYKMDKSLRYETNSISSMQEDKKMLEDTLSGMQDKILDHQDKPSELQKLKKQQKMIEKELIRVKRFLSSSAKKIEDAATKNDQMEKDILHLRQILKEALKTGSSETKSSRADLEAELSRVQTVLDELANHRHEINHTVVKLQGGEVRASPTGVAGCAALPGRKKQHSMYLETDLDTLETRDLALKETPVHSPAEEIYENLNVVESISNMMQNIDEADDRMKRFYGILPREKPSEIKTVRIVKRQSERRKKRVNDEPSSDEGTSQPDIPVPRPTSLPTTNQSNSSQSAHERLFGGKRTKRRHYTVSGYQYALDPQFAQYFNDAPRSRDDMDMERCLRTANTPDIVRSTIKKNDVFDDQIIDRELGLPPKVDIPERYIEMEPERLSASEKLQRSRKAENIAKRLAIQSDKRQLLNLNSAIAHEAAQRTKAATVFAIWERSKVKPLLSPVDESPRTPLPITQQRYNYLT